MADAFLAACFRNMNGKPDINFDSLASETGMSIGGAKNKLRDILKKLESGDNSDSGAVPTTPAKAKPAGKPKTPASKGKRNAPESDQDDAEHGEEMGSPKKKCKATSRKKNAKADKAENGVEVDSDDRGKSGKKVARKGSKSEHTEENVDARMAYDYASGED